MTKTTHLDKKTKWDNSELMKLALGLSKFKSTTMVEFRLRF